MSCNDVDINTNYIGIKFGAFEVVEYCIDRNKNIINMKVRCSSCGEYRKLVLLGNKVIRIKCPKCGRLDIVIPVEYYEYSSMVKDTITIGAYQYSKMRAEYKRESRDGGEYDFIKNKLYGIV